MTLPESAGRASPDDAEPHAAERDDAEPVPPGQYLTDKPVLEWTEDDWARWIDMSSRPPLARQRPPSQAAGAEERKEAHAAEDVRLLDELAGFDDDPQTAPMSPIVDLRLPDEEPPGAGQDIERPWDEPPELGVQLDKRRRVEPTGATVEAQSPSAEAQHGADTAAITTPAAVPERPPPAPTPAGPAPRAPTPPPLAPPARARPSRPAAAVAVEPSHRIRAAFALLGVAVTVGVIVAALITVTLFAVGVALRRAVG